MHIWNFSIHMAREEVSSEESTEVEFSAIPTMMTVTTMIIATKIVELEVDKEGMLG